MKSALAAAVVGALLLAAPAQAHAAPWLGKGEAQTEVDWHAYKIMDNAEGAVDYRVRPAHRCKRLFRNVVQCGFQLGFVNGRVCNGVLRILEYRRSKYDWALVRGPECEPFGYDPYDTPHWWGGW